ncbi:MAG: hypothetical protein HKN33_02490 [Pyrinomonadaceae bacterium]|nr:hypothetical protein [Pyrinomonadaceae bacterium]
MKTFAIVILVFFASACIETHEHYTAELTTNPEEIESGTPVEFSFLVKKSNGEIAGDLEIVHEKPMHLFMVSSDLSQYFHEHPKQQADSTYLLPFTFPNGGNFKIFIDFKPKDDEQTVESFDVEVAGDAPEKVELVPDEVFEKSVEGITVKMKPDGELLKHKDLVFKFDVFDSASGEPVTDLENYLGAKAHFVIIRKGLGRFVHAHPMSPEEMANMSGGMKMKPDAKSTSQVSAMTNFPNSGVYKVFAQFKRNGKVITVTYVLQVK